MSAYYEKFAQIFAWISALLFLILSGSFLFLLVRNGLSSFYELNIELYPIVHRLFPAILGTACVIILTLIFACPLGIAIGVWTTLFAKKRSKRVFNFVIQLLASTPSIVLGFAGYFAILFFRQKLGLPVQPCLLLSALCLSLLVMPVLVRSTENSLSQIPDDLKMTGLSLGLSPLKNAVFVLLPNARKGLGRGVFLATLRAAEDTAIIMLTGAVADAILPTSLSEHFSSLSIQILFGITENRGPQDQMIVYATSLVLITLSFLLAFAGEKVIGGHRHVS